MVGRTVLVVAAHPDDEVLGCGGAMARHADQGDSVHVLILAEGATSRAAMRQVEAHSEEINALRGAAQEAARILGAATVSFGGFADNRMDGVELIDVVKVVEEHVSHLCPEVVYTHHAGDLNVDHGVVCAAVMTACRPLPDHPVRRILHFEVASSTEWHLPGVGYAFLPNHFINVSAQLERKSDALRAYAAEMRESPHARSIAAVEALARWRGATVGHTAAEAFVLARSIED